MTSLVRLKPLIAVAASLVLATAGVAVHGGQQSASEGPRDPAKTAPAAAAAAADGAPALADRQLALIDNALDALHHLARNSRVELSDPAFALWERRRIETLRKAGKGKAEIVAALEKYLDRLKEEEELAEARRQAARASIVDVFDVQFRRMEAEGWLNDEKAR
jgi:hypothetical protein